MFEEEKVRLEDLSRILYPWPGEIVYVHAQETLQILEEQDGVHFVQMITIRILTDKYFSLDCPGVDIQIREENIWVSSRDSHPAVAGYVFSILSSLLESRRTLVYWHDRSS